MKRILLCCTSGMSANMVVNKMKFAAFAKDVNVEIKPISIEDFEDYIFKFDCFLLGPQVKHKLLELKNKTESKDKPFGVIDSLDYGLMNGEKILNDALLLMN
ncbi:PTS sugar transporter subunit IIB [Vibrio natriegens]|uniref:PTS sugar transporter subunit IIB n=1 Tax=Vibrio natriegens TaxID=691 RepID=UPI001EFC5D7A|nr:PTS sugar transporter subunit IIB [Vibrio natriegens]MCG9702651.1 PTS sugar transporter subunit IIB [Vibrio natriegens]